MPKDLIQRRDNTSVNIGTAEYPRYSKPWIPDYLEGMFQYNAGNYLDKNARAYANKLSGKVNNTYPEFDLLLLKGFIPKSNTLSKRANWRGDSVELTKERLANGGFDRLQPHLESKEAFDYNVLSSYTPGKGIKLTKTIPGEYSPEVRTKILNAKPTNWTSEQAGIKPTNIGTARRNGSLSGEEKWGVVSDAIKPYHTGQPKSDLNAHEFAHYVFGPVEKPPLEVYNGVNAYLRKPTEINARGTQIKNYFGLKENEPLTENMLKYAEKHYIKDRGYDNNMTQFFSGIKDWKEMAKWLQEFSPAASIPLIMNNGNNTTNK